MNFKEWFLEMYGRDFKESFPVNDAEYEYEYLQWCEYDNIEPDWTGRHNEGGIMMKTYEETLELEVAERQELLEKVRTQWKKVESVEAVKAILDGKVMTYLGKLEGSSKVQLLHVLVEQKHLPLNMWRFVVLDEKLRQVDEMNSLPRLLGREWYERILTDRETLLSMGYDQVQVAKMTDEDVEAEMEQLAAGGME